MWNSVLPVLSLQFTKRVLCWVPGPPLSSSYWTDRHVVLCSLVDCTMIWPPCGTVFTGGMHGDLTTRWYYTVFTGGMHGDLTAMWYCVHQWNAVIWPPCDTVLTGGMHCDLTAMWYCVDWWNAWWSDCHVVLCSLVECTMIWPPCDTVMHNDLTTMWHCVHWWNAQWFESTSAFIWS